MFPNEYDVYMHDTPATELFSKSRRDFSHGCIRLENPVDLAVWFSVTIRVGTLTASALPLNGTESAEVTLAHPIPVLIVYGTVMSRDGVVHSTTTFTGTCCS